MLLQLLLRPRPQLIRQLRLLRMPETPATLLRNGSPVVALSHLLLRPRCTPQLRAGSIGHVHQKQTHEGPARLHDRVAHARRVQVSGDDARVQTRSRDLRVTLLQRASSEQIGELGLSVAAPGVPLCEFVLIVDDSRAGRHLVSH